VSLLSPPLRLAVFPALLRRDRFLPPLAQIAGAANSVGRSNRPANGHPEPRGLRIRPTLKSWSAMHFRRSLGGSRLLFRVAPPVKLDQRQGEPLVKSGRLARPDVRRVPGWGNPGAPGLRRVPGWGARSPSPSEPRVAIIADWTTGQARGEAPIALRVVQAGPRSRSEPTWRETERRYGATGRAGAGSVAGRVAIKSRATRTWW
jgi:hypothetical protein